MNNVNTCWVEWQLVCTLKIKYDQENMTCDTKQVVQNLVNTCRDCRPNDCAHAYRFPIHPTYKLVQIIIFTHP